MVKALVKRLLRRLGYVVVRANGPVVSASPQLSSRPSQERSGRDSLDGTLRHLQRLGLAPRTVIDVGAAFGDFGRLSASLFPGSRILMLEPLVEYRPSLDRLVSECPQSIVRLVAAASQSGMRAINVHPDLVGSSFLRESEEDSDVNGRLREVPVTTIDAEMLSLGLAGPILLKVDVQGAELEVLSGAGEVLPRCEVVILEASLFNTMSGGPLVQEVIAFMAARRFCIYDIVGHLYRPLDGALCQVDVVFVPIDSGLRRYQAYATAAQRTEQTKRFVADLAARGDALARHNYEVSRLR